MKEKFEEIREQVKSAFNQATQHPWIQENIMQKPKVLKGIVAACCVLCVLGLAKVFFGGVDGGVAGETAGGNIGNAGQVKPAKPSGKTWTNSIGMEFVQIPAGSYLRGTVCDPNFDNTCFLMEDAMPQREINISSFWLGKYEVTQEQWVAVMGSNPSMFKGRTNPVERVSWNDAQEFVRRLNAKEGHNRYRLPTEAEWEYAARAGSTTAYCFGDDENQLSAYAWYRDNSGKKTHPVGQKRANAWGLHDMHGNVWEWVNDRYDRNYYRSGSDTDPRGPSEGAYRVLRGGNWDNAAMVCRAAFRDRNPPDYRLVNYGFRLALSPGH